MNFLEKCADSLKKWLIPYTKYSGNFMAELIKRLSCSTLVLYEHPRIQSSLWNSGNTHLPDCLWLSVYFINICTTSLLLSNRPPKSLVAENNSPFFGSWFYGKQLGLAQLGSSSWLDSLRDRSSYLGRLTVMTIFTSTTKINLVVCKTHISL